MGQQFAVVAEFVDCPPNFVFREPLLVRGDFQCGPGSRFEAPVYVGGNCVVGKNAKLLALCVEGDCVIGLNARVDTWVDAAGSLTMANGRRSRLTYHKEGPPILSARIQELYGIEGKFTIGHGRVAVKIEVLAPNQRPIQVTDDLTNFWREQYPKVKAELSRRYPRHEWR